jgi:aryl-alcohol dehydrogenase-like predicted oxidoreductase
MWNYEPWKQDTQKTLDNISECLVALQAEVEKGNIRHFGLSNDSAWGTVQWLEAAKEVGGPRVATLQNEYSLMYRHADLDLAEMMQHEDVGLLPYSPLGAGLLTGKYQNGAIPEGSRMAINGDLGNRKTERAFAAVAAYQVVADRFGIDLTHMALAFSAQRPFVCSSIFGATTCDQLEYLLKGAGLKLSDENMKEIDAVHKAHPFPF